MGNLLLDLRYSFRLLRRAPGFAAVAILTLALGLGANIAIFSIASPMLLEPLPFPHPERMVEVVHYYHGEMQNGLTADEAIQIDRQQQVFSADAIVDVATNANLYAHGTAVKVAAMRVSHGFFGVYGVAPVVGRPFIAADDVPGTGRTAVLSDGLWRSEFGGRPNVVGETFQMNGAPYTVIGVMPASFSDLEEGPSGFQPTSLWTAMQPTVAELAELGPNLDLLGRLRPGLSMAQAQSAMDVMKADYNRSHPKSRMTWGMRSFHDAVVGDSSAALWLLLAAVGMVLLIACANIANLLLSRSTGRAREMAIRAAVGASQGRVARQLLTESLVLSSLGAAAGGLLAWVAIPWLHRMTPEAFALPITAGWNAWTAAFIVGLALVTGVVFGFAPALHARKLDLQGHLKDSVAAAAAPGAGRARSTLIVAEVALAFVLLAAAGMFIASLMQLDAVKPGFQTADVMTAQSALTGARQTSDALTTRFTEDVLQHLRSTPGVVTAATITGIPLMRAMNYSVEVTGNPDSGNYSIEWRAISPGFFDTLRIPIVAGRDFSSGDTAAAPKVAIVSQGFARQFWPRQSPLGKTAFLPDPVPGGKQGTMYQIVGVASDIRENGLDQAPPVTFYVPQAQTSDAINSLVNHWFPIGFVVRGEPSALAPALRAAFAATDSTQPVFNVRSLDEIRNGSLGQTQFLGALIGGFAALALALAAIGIYGVLAYAVAARTREIGIRIALGASRRQLLRQFTNSGLRLAALGLALGLAGALALHRLLGSFLYGVQPTDARVLALCAGALLVVAYLAALQPAWRATRIDPLDALRG